MRLNRTGSAQADSGGTHAESGRTAGYYSIARAVRVVRPVPVRALTVRATV